ncbi:Uncharacterised protein [Escherichia coli]|uniref:Uncharacterized protein n=1 Tax=Escherichia coli TaxID=562 RepID=A0A377K0L7_ECOLX|nr:Uncharacterised protein [Escherichia coli]
MKQSAGNINDKTSRFFRQTNNISKYDSSRRGKKFFTCTILKKNGDEQKWGDIPGKYRYQMMLKSRNSVPGLKGMRISICVYL